MLAAGSGRRFGVPKALADTGGGPWVLKALSVMSGCDEIVVVIGAGAERVAAVLPERAAYVVNSEFETGMGSSLAAGLAAIAGRAERVDAVLVMLVDLPDVTQAVIDRMCAQVRGAPDPAAALSRAAYGGRPGHPVLIGRDHFAGVIGQAVGDSGAREYLSSAGAELIECSDIGGGRDVDTPDQLGDAESGSRQPG